MVRSVPMRCVEKRAVKSAPPQVSAVSKPIRIPMRLNGLAFFRLKTEDGHHFLKIFPDFALGVGIAQKISRMIGGHEFAGAKVEPLAAKLRDSAIGFQERLGRDRSEANNDFGRDDVELAQKKGRAGADFVFFGRAILWRAAFDDVADVNVFALQAHGFDHLREKFSGATNKRESLGIFVGARTFSHENEFGFCVSVAEDNCVAMLVKLAARAFAKSWRIRKSVSSVILFVASNKDGAGAAGRGGGAVFCGAEAAPL